MPNAIIDTALISAVVNAVREKGGTTDVITLGDLPQAVADLPSGGSNEILLKLLGMQGSNTFSLTATDLAGIAELRQYAFRGCTSLKSIELPSGCKKIGSNALYGAIRCETVILPSTITTIDSASLNINNTSISHYLYCYMASPPSIGTNVLGTSYTAIYVPSSSVESYKSATNWANYANLIQAIPE